MPSFEDPSDPGSSSAPSPDSVSPDSASSDSASSASASSDSASPDSASSDSASSDSASSAGSADDAAEAVESDLSELSALQAVEAERDDYLDALRRLQADFENFRKRTIKQQTDLLERASMSLVEKLLHVLDATDAAMAHGAGEHVAQIANLLMETLAKEGLEGIDPKPGDPFDPTVHEAVAHEPAEADSAGPEVSELLRAGYRFKGALLRPAMVKVRG